MSSYQKYDGASGTYQSTDNGSSDFDSNGSNSPRGRTAKWVGGTVLVAVIAAVYLYTSPFHKINAESAIKDSIHKTGGLKVSANGKLKLFDDLSKFNFICFFIAW